MENAFVGIENCSKAQAIADRFPALRWEAILHAFARRVNPLLTTVLSGMEYYWVIDQAEYATDVMFCNHAILDALYLNWQRHAAVCSLIQTDAKYRPSVTRIKHTMRGNWIKMYNKQGIVLRVETVINRPREFRISRLGRGKQAITWAPMPKRVSSMRRYKEICLRANRAYLSALTEVDHPAQAYRQLDRLCEPAKWSQQRVRGLNPLRKSDRVLFEAVVRGEHFLQGFRASDLAMRLEIIRADDPSERKRQSANLNRKLRLLRGHGLIVRIPHSRRYKITDKGMKLMNAAIDLRTYGLPEILKQAA